MIKRGIQIAILFSIIIGFPNCKKQENDILYSKKYINEIKAARKEVEIFLAINFVPGATIAISKNGELIYSEGIGLASKDLNARVTRNTKFRIGALSELFTSAIYMKMLEEGKLHPDSTVQHYYPNFPKKNYPIKLQHLSNHTSGIRKQNSKEQNWRGLNISLEKGIENFKDDELITPSGLYQTPSSLNYNLLAVVMEKVGKKRFRELLADYVSDTLHLNNTVIDNPLLTIEGRSNFFDHTIMSQVINATTIDLGHRSPSEGILSNAEDLVLFANALFSSVYFTDETKKKLFEKTMLDNGREPDIANGWMIMKDRRGNLVYGKDGSVIGGSASIFIFPEEELVIACATNLTGASADFPILKIASLFLPADEENTEDKASE